MMIIIMIVGLFLICYFPFIMCVHCIENKNLSKILSGLCIHFYDVAKIINTHIHDYWFVSGFQQKKTGKQEKKKKNYDVSAMLLLVVAARANERADGAGATTKRKAWPTSSSNREEKVCMYAAAVG